MLELNKANKQNLPDLSLSYTDVNLVLDEREKNKRQKAVRCKAKTELGYYGVDSAIWE